MTSPSLTAAAQFANRLKMAVVATCLLMLVAGTGVLCFRRLAGGLSSPLSSGGLILLALIVLLTVLIVRSGVQELRQGCVAPYRFWRWLPVALAVLIALAISVPGSPQLGLLALWLTIGMVVGSEIHLAREAQPNLPVTIVEPVVTQPVADALSVPVTEFATETAEVWEDETVVQQLVRRCEASGEESIHGHLRAKFAAGERTTWLHVAFCPPFEQLPECSAEPVDGAAAGVKIGQILPQGARLGVKLEQISSEPESVLLEFSAWIASKTAE